MDRGFTLVELLIAVTIILVLAIVGLRTFTSQMRRSRDSVREVHLEKIRTALEAHKSLSSTKEYPNLLDDLDVDQIEGKIPDDPSGFAYFYTRTSGSTYELCAYFETGGNDDCGNNCQAPENCNIRVTQ